MNCFGRSQHHLICIVFRYHRTGQPINQHVRNLKTHATCSSLFVVFNYKCIPDACPFCCDVNLAIRETHHPTPGNSGYPTCLPSQGSYWLYVCPIHSRYQTGNLWKILLVWDWIPYGGWMLVYGTEFHALWRTWIQNNDFVFRFLNFNSRINSQHLTNWTRWNKRDKVWNSSTSLHEWTSLFKWRFRNRRRCRCLSSLLTINCYFSLKIVT